MEQKHLSEHKDMMRSIFSQLPFWKTQILKTKLILEFENEYFFYSCIVIIAQFWYSPHYYHLAARQVTIYCYLEKSSCNALNSKDLLSKKFFFFALFFSVFKLIVFSDTQLRTSEEYTEKYTENRQTKLK